MAATFGRDLARIEKELKNRSADIVEGVCVGMDWASRLASVNIGGGVQMMRWDGYPPNEGDTVRVTYAGRVPTCRVVYGAAAGSVQSVASGIATVLGDDDRVYVYPAAVTVAFGNRVRLDHAGRMVVAAYPAEPGTPVYEVEPAPPARTEQERWFYPIDSGNYRFGTYYSGPAEVSSNRAAYYWYGTQIAGSIPDDAQILFAEVSLAEEWDNVPGTPSKLGTHGEATRSGSAPGLTGAIDVFGGGGINLMPGGDTSFPDRLKSGGAYGLGFAAGFGWRRFSSAASSGGIRIRWK